MKAKKHPAIDNGAPIIPDANSGWAPMAEDLDAECPVKGGDLPAHLNPRCGCAIPPNITDLKDGSGTDSGR